VSAPLHTFASSLLNRIARLLSTDIYEIFRNRFVPLSILGAVDSWQLDLSNYGRAASLTLLQLHYEGFL
jgi:hypothetical protein